MAIVPQSIKNIKHFMTARFFHLLYGRPSSKLKIIGVTGTDGKTTTSNIIYEIMKASGKKVGLISTINAKIGEEEFPLSFHVTNPSPKDLQKYLSLMVKNKIEYVVLETTSHGLDQHRVEGIHYIAAVYTNITHEHLDYHKTYENYMKTKGKLIKKTRNDGFIVLNKDDKAFDYLFSLSNDLERKVITYGFSKGADIHADELVSEHKLMHFALKIQGKTHRFKTSLKGRYNVSNIMAGIATTHQLGIDMKTIKDTLENMPQLEGRWEILQEKPFSVIVDFAHTPNALEHVLIRASNSKAKNKKLIVVFGCAGKRDKSKRPLMGRVAANLADTIILTAEDPRGEDVLQINREIEDGAKRIIGGERKEIFSIPDREQAIVKAILRASKGDIIVITGKGHERSMNIDGKNEIPWSDKNITLKYLRK